MISRETIENGDRPADAAERAYQDIRVRITTGELTSGTPLREAPLSKVIGVSRTPVRAALVRLDAEGLVEIIPNRGAFVAAWTKVDLEEIFGLRVVLESYGVGLAAAKATVEQIEELSELADRMDDALDRQRPGYIDVCTDLNIDFHMALMRVGRNRRLQTLLSSLYEQPLLHRTISMYSTDHLKRAWMQHRELIAAMEMHDASWATVVMRAHLLAGRTVMLEAERRTAAGVPRE